MKYQHAASQPRPGRRRGPVGGARRAHGAKLTGSTGPKCRSTTSSEPLRSKQEQAVPTWTRGPVGTTMRALKLAGGAMRKIKIVIGAVALAASAVALPASSAMASGGTVHTIRMIAHQTANKTWPQEPAFVHQRGLECRDRRDDWAGHARLRREPEHPQRVLRRDICAERWPAARKISLSLTNQFGSSGGTITGGTRDVQHVTGGTMTASPAGTTSWSSSPTTRRAFTCTFGTGCGWLRGLDSGGPRCRGRVGRGIEPA